MAQRIFIGNVSYEVTPDQLHALCLEVGPVLQFELRPDPSGVNRHRGQGYVIYPDEATAMRALQQCNGRVLCGRAVKFAHMEPAGNAPGGRSTAHGGSSAGLAGLAPGAVAPGAAAWAPPRVRERLDALSPAEVRTVLSELRGQAAAHPDATRHLLRQYPVLAQSVLYLMGQGGALRVPTAAYAAAAAAQEGLGAAGAGAGGGVAPGGAPPPSARGPQLSEDERVQLEMVRGILALGEDAVAAMPAEQREGVQQIRAALKLPIEQIHAQPPQRRAELLELREQLTGLLQRA
jgi:cleavage stimulation factor subunit 2